MISITCDSDEMSGENKNEKDARPCACIGLVDGMKNNATGK